MNTRYLVFAGVLGAFAAVGTLQGVADQQAIAAAAKNSIEALLDTVVGEAHACPPSNGGGGGRQGNNGYGNGGGDGVPGKSGKQDRTR